MNPELFQRRILNWFERCGRKNLPWQKQPDPYRIWVSEIMLQQTQVTTVIPYYHRFIQKFPDVDALAQSDLDTVLTLWAGLGYYARARNLHKSAQSISESGKFPNTLETLMQLPGIGRSTAGAILAMAFNQRQAILDGNVRRVLARVYAIEGWPGLTRVNKRLWLISEQLTPGHRVADYTQAMMDLGATVCKRNQPNCSACPVNDICQAHMEKRCTELPFPKPRKTLPIKQTVFLVLEDGERQVMLKKRPGTGIWGGLWSLPEVTHIDDIQIWCSRQNIQIIKQTTLPENRHTFSHFHLDYTPVRVMVKNPGNCVLESRQSVWYKSDQIKTLGLPAPIKQLLEQVI